jgi:hypothetical protein
MCFPRTRPFTLCSLWVLLTLIGGCTERRDEQKPVDSATSLQTSRSSDGGYSQSAKAPVPQSPDVDIDLLAGELDTSNRFTSAVSVITKVPNGRGFGTQCSGVLLAPRLVLTAGHCVCKRQRFEGSAKERLTLIDGSSCVPSAKVSTVVYEPPPPGAEGKLVRETYQGKVQPHPDFKLVIDAQENVFYSKADLAFIVLDIPVGAEISTAPLVEARVKTDASIVMVSYGYDIYRGTLGGDRHINEYKVTHLPGPGEDRVLFHQPQRDDYTGDSGGPCFQQGAEGLSVVGISSRSIGREPGLTSLQPYHPWIRDALQRTTQADSGSPP